MMERDKRVQHVIEHAYQHAKAFRDRMDGAGLSPSDVQSEAELIKIPVLPKDDLIALQQADPPFGGMLGVPARDVRHIFMSPGPIYEPDAGDETTVADAIHNVLRAVGFGPNDVVINALSYHLVPAGLLLDNAFTAVGCTVVPTGVGNSELQVKIMRDLSVTGFVGTPSFLINLLKTAERMEVDIASDLNLSKALLTAEPLFPEQRSLLVDTYGLFICNAYATAELGILAYDVDGTRAMKLMAEPIIQVLDPETGEHVAPGEAGEVVVTNYNVAYPLIRFGTGDMGIFLDPDPAQSSQGDCAVILVGRSGEAAKVKGMFVHPNQLRFAVGQVAEAVGGADRVQGEVSRFEGTDHFAVRIAMNGAGVNTDSYVEQMQKAIQKACRVRVDEILFVDSQDIAEDAPGMVDKRQWS